MPMAVTSDEQGYKAEFVSGDAVLGLLASDKRELEAMAQIDAYLGTLGSGRTIVEASEVRDLLLDIRTTLKGA